MKLEVYLEDLLNENTEETYLLKANDYILCRLVSDLKNDLMQLMEVISVSKSLIKLSSTILEQNQFNDLSSERITHRIVKFRLDYENTLSGNSKSRKVNRIVQIIVTELLDAINKILKNSIDRDNHDLRIKSEKTDFYNIILKTKKVNEIRTDDFLRFVTSIDNIVSMIDTNGLVVDSIPVFIVNNYNGTDFDADLKFDKELIGFDYLNKNSDYYVFYNPSKRTLVEKLFLLGPSIIHYSGHSGRNGIPLVFSDETLNGKGISNIYQKSGRKMQFIFLNSCESSDMAKIISSNCQASTIGNQGDVFDSIAQMFCEVLYSLPEGNNVNKKIENIPMCFDSAINITKSRIDNRDYNDVDSYEIFCDVYY